MKNNTFRLGLLLLVFYMIFSCASDKDSTETTTNYELILKEKKTFILDEETGFDRITGQYFEIDEVGYYSFFNRQNMHLYFYNYSTGKLEHQIKLAKEGPNQIDLPYYFFQYWVYDFDNIFINTLAFQYRINKEGEVLKRIREDSEGSYFSKKNFSYDASTSYTDGKLYTSSGAIIPEEGDSSWRRSIYDFEKEQYVQEYVDERILVAEYDVKVQKLREMAKSGGVSSLTLAFAGSFSELYGTTAINDSLYLFEGIKYIGAYYAGDPNIEVTDLDGYFNKTKVETFEGGGVSIGPKTIQPAFYTSIFQSPDKKFIYRILIHGTKAYVNPANNEEEPKVFGASLIVFNTQNKTSGAVDLPVDEIDLKYYSNDIFVTQEGIHFPVLETESEDEKSYFLYSVQAQ